MKGNVSIYEGFSACTLSSTHHTKGMKALNVQRIRTVTMFDTVIGSDLVYLLCPRFSPHTLSCTSDLARRLRELDFTIFLAKKRLHRVTIWMTLRKALLNSHALVVVANREMLEDPVGLGLKLRNFAEHVRATRLFLSSLRASS